MLTLHLSQCAWHSRVQGTEARGKSLSGVAGWTPVGSEGLLLDVALWVPCCKGDLTEEDTLFQELLRVNWLGRVGGVQGRDRMGGKWRLRAGKEKPVDTERLGVSWVHSTEQVAVLVALSMHHQESQSPAASGGGCQGQPRPHLKGAQG